MCVRRRRAPPLSPSAIIKLSLGAGTLADSGGGGGGHPLPGSAAIGTKQRGRGYKRGRIGKYVALDDGVLYTMGTEEEKKKREESTKQGIAVEAQ